MEQSPVLDRRPSNARALHNLSPERLNGSRRSRRMSKQAAEYPSVEGTPTSPTRKHTSFDFSQLPGSPSKENRIELVKSPTFPDISSLKTHVRTNSDVQGLVKRFEHLDVRDREAESAERRKKQELELRRAQVAREEAETDVKRLREEVRRLKKEGDEAHDRERRVGKRLEVVMEEYATSKETHATQIAVYEKEVRKARKEAFKTSSAVLKLQEELKSTRNSLRATQSTLDLQKRKVSQKEQETFSAQYQFVAIQEEMEKVKAELKTVQEERDALKTSLKEEEVARVAAEGRIALPPADHDDDDLMSPSKQRSPRKRPVSPLSDDKENVGVVTKKLLETRKMAEEIVQERQRRRRAEEMVEYLRTECRFHCCSCQTHAIDVVDDVISTMSDDIADVFRSIRANMRSVLGTNKAMKLSNRKDSHPRVMNISMHEDTTTVVHGSPTEMELDAVRDDRSMTFAGEIVLEEDPVGLSLHERASSTQPPMRISTVDTSIRQIAPAHSSDQPSDLVQELEQERPQTPVKQQIPLHTRPPASIRTVTTTTTIPMHFTPAKPSWRQEHEHAVEDNLPITQPNEQPGVAPRPFDREAALAAIAYRRGRAKSIADGHVTPRKQMIEGVSLKERRDISAPALGQKPVVAHAAKGTASASRAQGVRTG